MGLYTKMIDIQKLKQAWEKVRQKKSAPGIDGVTVEMMEGEIRSVLKQLNLELKEQRYEPMPVRMIVLQKGDKEREVGLFCLRDKIVQQSAAYELHRLYDDGFAAESYAFHSSRSALEAVAEVEKAVGGDSGKWVLKTDIRHFFDEISHEKLMELLRKRVHEEEALQLVRQFLTVPMLDENGELHNKMRGIYQGATIAPLLSNIYLDEFDHQVREKTDRYFRYADDILCIDRDRSRIEAAADEIRRLLAGLGLALNEEKTKICQVRDEFEYLGYRFGADGKQIPAKKEAALKERLEELWMQNLDFEQKADKGLEIINGWLQYFTGKRRIESIYELVLEIYRETDRGKSTDKLTGGILDRLELLRRQFTNIHPDICHFLAQQWKTAGRRAAELMEYEQLWQVEQLDAGSNSTWDDKIFSRLISEYEKLLIREDKEGLENMMQLYADLHCYNKASVFDRRLKEMERAHRIYIPDAAEEMRRGEEEMEGGRKESTGRDGMVSGDDQFSLNEAELDLFYQLFAGREDIYAREAINAYGKRAYETVNAPLTQEVLEEAMRQQVSLATYVQRNNATAHFMVFDLDISKKILLKYSPETEEFRQYLNLVKEKAYLLRKVLMQMGLSSLLEFSGFRGYHIWVFFQEWISVRYIHMLQDAVLDRLKREEENSRPDGAPGKGEEMEQVLLNQQEFLRQGLLNQQEILIELFPNRTRVTGTKPGQCIRLPFSRHIRTGKRSCFLDEAGYIYGKQAEALGQAVQYPLSAVKRIIALNGNEGGKQNESRNQGGSGSQSRKGNQDGSGSRKENGGQDGNADYDGNGDQGRAGMNTDICGLYPDLKPAVKIVLEQCNLMAYLCRKAKMTGYLTHFERQTIVYVFGHLGEDGKLFVHQVMENTLNYRYAVTERFIRKLPEKPISCIKIREQYKQITAEIGCNCRFKRTKNCYPSPVLHAVKDNEEIQQDITLPLSRDISHAKEKQIYEEINIHRKAQELAGKLLEFKKQQRGIDKNVRKLEDELTEIFNNASVDCMEIDMGLLSRRRKGERYEWVIEL